MAIWDSFFKSGNTGPATLGNELGYGDAQYNDSSMLGAYKPLSYQECKDIYLYWPLGKRVASALPNFAMSAGRTFVFKDLPPICDQLFIEMNERMNIDNIVKNTSIYSRVYGLAAVFVGVKDEDIKTTDKINFEKLDPKDIYFNIMDPLNLVGLQIGQDPLLPTFQKVSHAVVGGSAVHLNRICPIFNDIPLYLKWNPSTYTWGSASVYQNMGELIKSWNRCVIALERLATKAGSIVFKNRDGGVVNSIVAQAANNALEKIRALQNDGACSIDKDASVDFFSLNGASEVQAIIDEMNKLIMFALSDTPSSILLDSKLAEGFSDGGEDMKALLMAVDNFRHRALSPLYNFLDYYLLRITFTDAVLQDILREYAADFKGVSIAQLREMILQNYSFKWGELYPEPESTKLDNQSKKLDNLSKLKELGANTADIEQLLNESKVFDSEIELAEQSSMDEHTDDAGGDSHIGVGDEHTQVEQPHAGSNLLVEKE